MVGAERRLAGVNIAFEVQSQEQAIGFACVRDEFGFGGPISREAL